MGCKRSARSLKCFAHVSSEYFLPMRVEGMGPILPVVRPVPKPRLLAIFETIALLGYTSKRGDQRASVRFLGQVWFEDQSPPSVTPPKLNARK